MPHIFKCPQSVPARHHAAGPFCLTLRATTPLRTCYFESPDDDSPFIRACYRLLGFHLVCDQTSDRPDPGGNFDILSLWAGSCCSLRFPFIDPQMAARAMARAPLDDAYGLRAVWHQFYPDVFRDRLYRQWHCRSDFHHIDHFQCAGQLGLLWQPARLAFCLWRGLWFGRYCLPVCQSDLCPVA